MNYKKLGYILLILIGALSLYQIVFAVPTSTILLRPIIPSLGSGGSPCLVISSTGLISTSTCGGGGSVTTSSPITINNFPYWVTVGGGLSGTSTLTQSSGNLNSSGTISINGDSVSTTTLSNPVTVAQGGTNATSVTAGSIIFASTTALLGQSNANLFWDNTNLRLGVRTTAPTDSLTIRNPSGVIETSFGGAAQIRRASEVCPGCGPDMAFMRTQSTLSFRI